MTTMLGAPRPHTTGPGLDGFTAFATAARQRFGVDDVALLTTMPRGGLQVCRGPAGFETAGRRYGTETHLNDASAWQALQHGVAHAADTAAPFGPEFIGVLDVRVESPVFGGYPGVVRLLKRAGGRGDFESIKDVAADVRRLFNEHNRRRSATALRQFVFVDDRLLMPTGSAHQGTESARVHAAQVLARTDPAAVPGRETVPGEDGVRVPVHVVRFDHYPALGSGRVVFVSLHPHVGDWSLLRGDDFSADPELSRLTAAVTFMVEHFRRSPTLGDVADAVHLSQFHFHRRFSELFGLTPKHLLYDLQLDEAQRMLADPRQQLASIAKHCGFAHQSHFTSRFKQGTGLTPTRWRRRAVTDAAADDTHAANGSAATAAAAV